MTIPDDDAYWRRPVDGGSPTNPPATGGTGVGGSAVPSGGGHQPGSLQSSAPPHHAGGQPPAWTYQGPPRAAPPPPGWRVPAVAEPRPPRRMPDQDHAALDAAERQARIVTYGFGIAAGTVLLVLLFVVCAQLIG